MLDRYTAQLIWQKVKLHDVFGIQKHPFAYENDINPKNIAEFKWWIDRMIETLPDVDEPETYKDSGLSKR